MSKITVLNEKAIAVEVPEATINPTISHDGRLRIENKTHKLIRYKPLPEGSWEVLGAGDNMTGGQWKEIVEQRSGLYGLPLFKDYTANELTENDGFTLVAANMSGHSLLKSKGLNPETIIILIKQ